MYYDKVFNNILKKWRVILSNYNRLYNNAYKKEELNTWLDLQEFMNHLNEKANESKVKPMDLLRSILLLCLFLHSLFSSCSLFLLLKMILLVSHPIKD